MIQTGNRNFWIAQILGWSIFTGSNLLVQVLAGLPKELLLCNSLTPMIVGFLLTSVYRYLIRESDWHNWSIKKMLIFLLSSTLLLTSVFLTIVFVVIRFILGLYALSLATILGNMFSFALVILTWNLIYFSIHYFNNWNQAEIEKWKLAAEMKDAQLGALKSQVRPHFVFNTINNIRSLILEDTDKAREMLINFSDLFRYSLKNSNETKVELEEELEIVAQYLELVSIQYEDKLQYDLNVEVGLEKIQVPPMMLQLLVENAVKHGISRYKEGGSVVIDIDQEDGALRISVRNTGNLKADSILGDQLGVGLENIKKRLILIYNGTATMQIREVENNVIATIHIPMP